MSAAEEGSAAEVEPEPTETSEDLGSPEVDGSEEAATESEPADDVTPDEGAVAGEESDEAAAAATSFAGDTAEQQLDECAQLVETISTERDEMRALAQRVQADFENYKRRVETQRSEQQDRAAEELVRSLLEVLDDCDLAASHGAEEVAPVAAKLLATLERQGLTAVTEVEVPFDPNLHEAVMSEEGDDEEPTVAAIMRTGYQWRKRLLRPAMVKVRS